MQITLCVYDSKAKAFHEPIYVPTVAIGIRAFKVACNTSDHDFFKFAEDYTLFETGTWDPATAKSVDLPTPKSLGLALSFIDKQEEPTSIHALSNTPKAALS